MCVVSVCCKREATCSLLGFLSFQVQAYLRGLNRCSPRVQHECLPVWCTAGRTHADLRMLEEQACLCLLCNTPPSRVRPAVVKALPCH